MIITTVIIISSSSSSSISSSRYSCSSISIRRRRRRRRRISFTGIRSLFNKAVELANNRNAGSDYMQERRRRRRRRRLKSVEFGEEENNIIDYCSCAPYSSEALWIYVFFNITGEDPQEIKQLFPFVFFFPFLLPSKKHLCFSSDLSVFFLTSPPPTSYNQSNVFIFIRVSKLSNHFPPFWLPNL